MAGARLWSAASLSEEEHAIQGVSHPNDTPTTIMDFEEDPMEGSDDTEPKFTPAKYTSKQFHSPDYTPTRLELLISVYDLDEGDEDTATSLDISPLHPNPSHQSFRVHTVTRVKQTPRKTTDVPSRKREASLPTSPPPVKRPCGEATWMPHIISWTQEEDIISRFEVKESSTVPIPSHDTPVKQAISLVLPQTTYHSDHIGVMDSEFFLLRMALRKLTERVQYLEEERDVMKMRTLLIQDQLQEARDEAQ